MAKKTKKKTKKSGGSMYKLHLLLAVLLMASIVFLPSAAILFIGMMPFFVAFFVDRSKKKTKAITVGAMNIAGCTPFLLELWTTEHTMERALSIILDPMAIIVIYSAAGIGYVIDWAVTILVANILYQRGMARRNAIEKRQTELIERWGEEVTGKIPLDHEGFPLDSAKPGKS